jgi:hypothetical protein
MQATAAPVGTAAAPGAAGKTDTSGRGYKGGFLSGLLFSAGFLLWIIGSALQIGRQSRFTLPGPLFGGLYIAASILW